MLESLAQLYSDDYKNNPWHLPQIKKPCMYIPVDSAAVVAAGIVSPERANLIEPTIDCNMLADKYTAEDAHKFEEYFNKQLNLVRLPDVTAEEREFMLHEMLMMYANPLRNRLVDEEAK